MEEKELNEIIKLEQLPIITQQLDVISKEIEKRVSNALKLECNEETVKEVKKVRADFNKEFKSLEDRRKQVKSAIMEKYDAFDEVYKEKIAELYKNADETLKEKIDSVELDLKSEKEKELRDFAKEYITANNLENILTFENIGLNITLSASMKSLKEETKAFIEKVAKDIQLIEMEEFKEEILFEYKNCFDFANAKMLVVNRHSAINAIKSMQEDNTKSVEQEKKIEEKVNEIIAPTEVEETVPYQFTVYATKTQAKQIMDFMEQLGVTYE